MRTIVTETTDSKQEDNRNLRPSTFSGYIGQQAIKDSLSIAIMSAKARQDTLDHILLYGPPGLGKTTLAEIIANEMGSKLVYIAGPSIEKSGDIASALTKLNKGDIIFIDEIHRMDIHAEEVLYSAMEDRFINITIGKDGQTKVLKLDLEPFTLIAATTRAGMLSQPLRDRFGHTYKLDYYTEDELKSIEYQTATKYGIVLNDESAEVIAKVSRGTPRIANRIVSRVRDYAIATDTHNITPQTIEQVLSLEGISPDGLTQIDKMILHALSSGKPLGLNTLSDLTGEDAGTIELVAEPYMLREGLLVKTSRGRVITEKGLLVLGITPINSQLTLFNS